MEDEQKKEPDQVPVGDADSSGYQFGLHADPLAVEDATTTRGDQAAAPNAQAPDEVPNAAASEVTTAAPPVEPAAQPIAFSQPASQPQTTLQDGSMPSDAAQVADDEKFSVDEVIGYGWRSMRKYFWPLLGILTSNFLVTSVPTAAVMVMNYSASSGAMQSFSMLISLFSILLNQAVALGTVNIWLKICEGDTIATRDVYSKFRLVWKFMGGTFLYWSMVILGYLCFILPGVYLQLRFQFFSYFIVDSGVGPIKALKASHAITKGCLAELFFLSIINWFIGWVGWMIILIGVFPAQAIQNIALARTYRQLLRNTPESELPQNMPPIPVIAEVAPNAKA